MSSVSTDQALYNHFVANIGTNEFWKNRHGSNCYVLWRSILAHLEGKSKLKVKKNRIVFKAPVRTLMEWSGISSFDTIYRCMATLDQMGLISTEDRGQADQYLRDEEGKVDTRKKGRPATYAVRLSDRTRVGVVSTSERVGEVVEKEGSKDSPSGAHRLPNSQFIGSDLVRSEPHLLRMLDLMAVWGEATIKLTARVISRRLGLAVSSCHEMLMRWKSKKIVSERLGLLMRLRDDWISTASHKVDAILMWIKRDSLRRKEALAGRYVNARQRLLQRRVLRVHENGFSVIDSKWSRQVALAQERGIGWLDPGEMLRAYYDAHYGEPSQESALDRAGILVS